MSLEGAIAANRFGLGARPGEIARASDNPKSWLMDQVSGPAPQFVQPNGQPFPNAQALVHDEDEFKVQKFMNTGDKKAVKEAENAQKSDKGAVQKLEQKILVNPNGNIRKEEYAQEMQARFALGFTTERPFAERLVRFWSNHFSVTGRGEKVSLFAGDFEREAIRPYVSGNFEDMLFAVVMHPAMQIYLDNWHSLGPDSPIGKKSGKGLNENLGRELMELHTLGVNGGYTQADVTAMAKLLTGWGVYGGRASGFGFFQERHEPGPITLRGKIYPAGWDGGVAAIKDLARDPATARNIARKFATHFISDSPPTESVARLEKVFNETHGSLHALSETIVNDPSAWAAEQKKMRTPVEYVTAAVRLTGWSPSGSDDRDRTMRKMVASVRVMGEVPFGAPSPKGWADTADAWNGADAMLSRVQWARDFGARIPGSLDVKAAAEAGLGPQLRPQTKTAMAGASNRREALALLFASPEFQRR